MSSFSSQQKKPMTTTPPRSAVSFSTNVVTPTQTPELPKMGSAKFVQHTDVNDQVMGRKAELEELRLKKLAKKLGKEYNQGDAAPTSEMTDFFLKQRELDKAWRKQQTDSREYLHQYRTKSESSPKSKGHKAQAPNAAYTTMSELDMFFYQQKNAKNQWRAQYKDSMEQLHKYRHNDPGSGSAQEAAVVSPRREGVDNVNGSPILVQDYEGVITSMKDSMETRRLQAVQCPLPESPVRTETRKAVPDPLMKIYKSVSQEMPIGVPQPSMGSSAERQMDEKGMTGYQVENNSTTENETASRNIIEEDKVEEADGKDLISTANIEKGLQEQDVSPGPSSSDEPTKSELRPTTTKDDANAKEMPDKVSSVNAEKEPEVSAASSPSEKETVNPEIVSDTSAGLASDDEKQAKPNESNDEDGVETTYILKFNEACNVVLDASDGELEVLADDGVSDLLKEAKVVVDSEPIAIATDHSTEIAEEQRAPESLATTDTGENSVEEKLVETSDEASKVSIDRDTKVGHTSIASVSESTVHTTHEDEEAKCNARVDEANVTAAKQLSEPKVEPSEPLTKAEETNISTTEPVQRTNEPLEPASSPDEIGKELIDERYGTASHQDPGEESKEVSVENSMERVASPPSERRTRSTRAKKTKGETPGKKMVPTYASPTKCHRARDAKQVDPTPLTTRRRPATTKDETPKFPYLRKKKLSTKSLHKDKSQIHVCDAKWQPNIHSARGGCEKCLDLASEEEVQKFKEQGHHYRIQTVRGGCSVNCTYFPRESVPVRLCPKCFYDTHVASRSTSPSQHFR